MGAQSIMRRAIGIATNFVMKIHIACQDVLQNQPQDIQLFPVVDGVYIVSVRQAPILFFIKAVMIKLALAFIFEEDNLHRFIVRGAISFGPVSTGNRMLDASVCLRRSAEYSNRIALGIPLSQAFDDEKRAAPFGVYLSECARSFAPPEDEVIGGTHWKWWMLNNTAEDNEVVKFLKQSVEDYYNWAKRHPTTLLYELDRMEAHLNLFKEYISD